MTWIKVFWTVVAGVSESIIVGIRLIVFYEDTVVVRVQYAVAIRIFVSAFKSLSASFVSTESARITSVITAIVEKETVFVAVAVLTEGTVERCVISTVVVLGTESTASLFSAPLFLTALFAVTTESAGILAAIAHAHTCVVAKAR